MYNYFFHSLYLCVHLFQMWHRDGTVGTVMKPCAGQCGVRIPSPKCLDHLWDPPKSPTQQEPELFFPGGWGVKQPQRVADQPHLFSAHVKKSMEQHLQSSYIPSWRIQGQILCKISSFCHGVVEAFTLLVCYRRFGTT